MKCCATRRAILNRVAVSSPEMLRASIQVWRRTADAMLVSVQPLGPGSAVRVLQMHGLIADELPAYDPFGTWAARRQQWSVPGRQWFSPLAYYTGPFDDDEGLVGASEFLDRYNISLVRALQVYLTATEMGFGIIPAVPKALPWWIAYDDISQVQLIPGTKGRLAISTPRRARKIGVTTITTKQHRKASFAGTPIGGLSALLSELGAQIVLSNISVESSSRAFFDTLERSGDRSVRASRQTTAVQSPANAP